MASPPPIHSKRLRKLFTLAIFLVIVSCCCTHFALAAREVSTGAGHDKAMRERYEKWMAEHGRTYMDSAEKARRFQVFKSNAHFIDSYNAAAAGPGGKSRPGLTTNKFADLTEAEFNNFYLRRRPRPPSVAVGTGFMYGDMGLSDVPASIDWREKGAVTPVKDQDSCGTPEPPHDIVGAPPRRTAPAARSHLQGKQDSAPRLPGRLPSSPASLVLPLQARKSPEMPPPSLPKPSPPTVCPECDYCDCDDRVSDYSN